MSTPFDELNDAVSDIYEAAVTPARWHDALRATVQFVRGERGMLSITNSSTGHLDVTETFQLDPNLIARWEVEHDRVNPWGDAIRQPAEGQVGRASDFKPYHLLERNRTFREIVIPLGIYDACWTALAANQLQRGFISAFQGQDRGPFSSESVERMTVLSPHLVRSARIYSQLGESAESHRFVAETYYASGQIRAAIQQLLAEIRRLTRFPEPARPCLR